MILPDPIALMQKFWPSLYIYNKQAEMLESVWNNKETDVAAMNQGGKDFAAALICLLFFISRHPCRIVTTSAGADHLMVLWGEINRHIDNSVLPLREELGGPLIVNHQHIRKIVGDKMCPISYITG